MRVTRSGRRAPVAEFSASDPSASIVVENLTKSFGGVPVLRDVSLAFRPGETHCLLGQNGSGKSTLIKIISGYHAPDPGACVRVGEHALTFGSPAHGHHLGLRFVHQQGAVVNALNSIENIALGSGFRHHRFGTVDWTAQERHTRTLLALLGVHDLDLYKPLSQVRAIERTAVALARAMDPWAGPIRFLFLDEPTASLPPTEVHLLFELIGRVTGQGVGVVYVTHRLDEVFQIGQTVSVLKDGRYLGERKVSTMRKAELIRLIVGPADARPGERASARLSVTPPPSGAALRVSGLRTALLDGISFDVRPGEILGFAGLAGSGRDELAFALGGALRSVADQLTVADRAVRLPLTPRRAIESGIAMAPSNTAPGSAIRPFSVRENLTLASLGRYTRHGRIAAKAEVAATRAWVDALGIVAAPPLRVAERHYSELSGGNQQKVIMAKWLDTRPAVLVTDDPTAGVDVGAREQIYTQLRDFAAGGGAVIICSSDLSDLMAVCHRVVVLRKGVIAVALETAAITEDMLTSEVMGPLTAAPHES